MPKVLNHKQMVITVHSIREDGVPDPFVPAEVFQSKLNTFLAAVKAADHAILPSGSRQVYVSYLKTGSAEIGFREAEIEGAPRRSAFDALLTCATAVKDGDAATAAKFDPVLTKLATLTSGVGTKFSHLTLSLDNAVPVRVDGFFDRQVKQIRKTLKRQVTKTPFFKGTSEESFDGVVKEVDLRGRVPLCKIMLSGSGNQIDCTFVNLDTEAIKDLLDDRAWVEGKAIYDGYSGLPVRFEIRHYRKIKQTGDPERWRGQMYDMLHEDWLDIDVIDQ